MSYCVEADVQAEFKEISFSGNASVSSADVSSFIAMEDALIDSRCALEYTVPLTGTKTLLIAKKISLALVVGKIKNILQVKTGDNKVGGGGDGDALIRFGKDMLQMIVDKTLILTDATVAAQSGAVASYTSNGGGVDFVRTFKIDENQW